MRGTLARRAKRTCAFGGVFTEAVMFVQSFERGESLDRDHTNATDWSGIMNDGGTRRGTLEAAHVSDDVLLCAGMSVAKMKVSISAFASLGSFAVLSLPKRQQELQRCPQQTRTGSLGPTARRAP